MAVVGHIDEIGLVVNYVDDEGMLWFGPVGGWDPQILVGQRVELQTDGGAIPGVVGKKPIHLLKDEERKKAPELKDLHIDIGAKDGDEARSVVRIGDVAVIAGEPVELLGERVVSRSMDNRLGAFVAFEAARLVAADGGAPGDVAAVAVAQEEITFAGATTSAFALEPGVAIVVDVTFATDAPGIDPDLVARTTRCPIRISGSQPPTPMKRRKPESSMCVTIRPISSMWPTNATVGPSPVPLTRAVTVPMTSVATSAKGAQASANARAGAVS